MSEEEALKKIDEIVEEFGYPSEVFCHSRLDDILCEVLTSLGYSKLVEKYQSIEKWYE